MVKAHRARRAGHRDGLRYIKVARLWIDRAAEVAILVVVVNRALYYGKLLKDRNTEPGCWQLAGGQPSSSLGIVCPDSKPGHTTLAHGRQGTSARHGMF
jgi:hypothetical protein